MEKRICTTDTGIALGWSDETAFKIPAGTILEGHSDGTFFYFEYKDIKCRLPEKCLEKEKAHVI